MAGRRISSRERILRPSVVALAAAISLGRTAHAGDHDVRILPPNAIQPAGASFEGYPIVGRQQKLRILDEIIRGTAAATIRQPFTSTALVGRRMTERMGVRVLELVPPSMTGITRRNRDSGRAEDDCLDLGGGIGGPPTPVRLTLLPGSEISIGALLALIPTAQSRIDLMMFGWDDDLTGRQVAAALAERAHAGVRVRLLVDRTAYLLHNAAAASGTCTFLDGLKTTPNVTVIEPPGAFMRFDHRKLAVIDERVAWTGGMILTDVARRRWHNLAFLAEGPIVSQYASVFAERWHGQGGFAEGPCGLLSPAPTLPPNAIVRLVRTDATERSLKDAVYHAVDHATKNIYLENPYFTDQILLKKLIAARRRGVDVRAILTMRGNVHSLNQLQGLTANRLLRGGVRVWLYPAMTHVKAMSADGVWAYIGTGNFDELSLRNNREVGLSVTGCPIVATLDRSLFIPDLSVSEELTTPLPPPENRLKLEALSLWY